MNRPTTIDEAFNNLQDNIEYLECRLDDEYLVVLKGVALLMFQLHGKVNSNV